MVNRVIATPSDVRNKLHSCLHKFCTAFVPDPSLSGARVWNSRLGRSICVIFESISDALISINRCRCSCFQILLRGIELHSLSWMNQRVGERGYGTYSYHLEGLGIPFDCHCVGKLLIWRLHIIHEF